LTLSRAKGRLCFSTYITDMKECDAPKSNSTTTEVPLMKNILMTMSGASWASSTTTWFAFPRTKFSLVVTGPELTPQVGAGVETTI
jgi:hypothetical protein